MKAYDIILQLFKYLPKYSNLFTTNIAVNSLSLSGLTVTAITSQAHNLQVGQGVYISGAIIKNPLVSLTQANNIATAITQFPHDLTEGYNATVDISGANQADYNGIKTLLSVPDRNTFTFSINNNPVSPATGTLFLLETARSINPYNGIQVVASVVNSTTFTYSINSSVYSPPVGTISMSTMPRIGGTFAVEKAEEWYTQKNTTDYWCFVVLNDSTVSRDRFSLDDSVSGAQYSGSRYKQRVITPFTVFIMAPLKDDTTLATLSGRVVRDQMEDVFHALCKSLLRASFPSSFSSLNYSQVVFVDHGFYSYNNAVYVHKFNFEATYDIVYDDTVQPDDNVAFRDLTVNSLNTTDGTTDIWTMYINLDGSLT